MTRFKNEAEAAKVVIAYLKDLRFEVYCEVQTDIGRIDIVAVQGNVVTSIEVKNQCNFKVLDQAISRWPFVNRSIAAFPFPKNRNSLVIRAVAKQTGIGIWDIKRDRIKEHCKPRLNRRPASKWVVGSLCEQQKNQDAGVNKGYWSPFQETKQKLIRHVRKNQPCTLKSAIEAIEHHYASQGSAYQSVGQWIRNGVINEVKMTKQGLVLANEIGVSK